MTLNWGQFINIVLTFVIVALVLFFLIRAINRLKREERSRRGADDQGLPVLPVGHPDQGRSLPALHVRAVW